MATNKAPISAEIITTGTEILLGEIVDTNAAWIAQQLRDAGVNLYYKTTVGDNEQRILSVLELGISRSDVVIVSGGLGPTVDDVTRQAIARAAGKELRIDAEALSSLKERFARFGVTMTENNLQQAMIPEGALVIPNPVGTAPGFIVDVGRSVIIAVPGVPREMKRLMQDTVIPYLREKSGNLGVIRRRVLRTVGIGESTLDHMLGGLMEGSNPTVGLAAKTGQVDIRIAARAETSDAADEMIEGVAEIVRSRVGKYVYSENDDETVEVVVVRLLRGRGETLSIVESNTAGAIAERIRSVVGGNDILIEAKVVEAAAVVTATEGPASESDPRSDACGLGEADAGGLSRATYCLSVLGTSDPDSGIYGSRTGHTRISLVGGNFADTRDLQYGGTDEFTVIRIANQALSVLWTNLRTRQ